MKYFTLLLASLFFVGANAQLMLVDPDRTDTDLSNTTINVSGVPADNDLSFPLSVINNSSQTYSIKCRRTEVDVLAGTTNTTCWVLCPPDVNAGDYPVMVIGQNGFELEQNMAPGDTATGFLAHYGPHNIDGCSLFKYEFFDAADPNTALATVFGRFTHNVSTSCTASLEEENSIDLNLYPNPVNDVVTIEVDKNYVDIQVVDLLGKTVLSQSNIRENNKVNVSELKNGVYFISVLKNGMILKTEKLVVKH